MKKQILISLLSLFSLSVFAQIPNYVPANGLVGWWPFNGNANDESGNGNNGTVNGATLTNDRFGNANKAYSFDGNVFIAVNDIGIIGTISRTISFWAKTQSTAPMGLVSFGGNGIYPNNGNRFSCDFNYGAQGVSIDGADCAITYTPINSVSNGGWHFYVFTMSQGNTLNQVKVYQNGVLLTIPNHNYLPLTNLNTQAMTQLHMGRINFPPNNFNYYMGELDDIGIWNRALTQCEIQDLYTSQINSIFVSAGADQTICNGEQVTLSASNSQNYSWNNGVLNSVPFSPTTTQDYIVTADTASCLSSDTVTVYVNQPSSSTLNQTALDSYTLNGQTYTQSGTYTQTVPAANGCDSVITLNLTLNFTGIHDLGNFTKILVKITDLNGKIIQRRKNTVMLFVYEDGTVERVVEME